MLVSVGAPDGSSTVRLPAQFVRPTDDRDGIVIQVAYPDLCQALLGAYVTESEKTVQVVVVGSRPADTCPARELIGQFRVTFDEPLGRRTISVG